MSPAVIVVLVIVVVALAALGLVLLQRQRQVGPARGASSAPSTTGRSATVGTAAPPSRT